MVASSPVCKYGWNVSISEDGSRFYRAAWSSSQDAQSEEPGSGREGRSGAAWAWFTLQRERLLTFAPRRRQPAARGAPRRSRPTQIREIDGSRKRRTRQLAYNDPR
jgi:hypothetical protein